MHSSAEILAVNISEYFSIRVLKYWLIYTMTCNYIDLHTYTHSIVVPECLTRSKTLDLHLT